MLVHMIYQHYDTIDHLLTWDHIPRSYPASYAETVCMHSTDHITAPRMLSRPEPTLKWQILISIGVEADYLINIRPPLTEA